MTLKLIGFTRLNKLKSKAETVLVNEIETISPKNVGDESPSNADFFTFNTLVLCFATPRSAIPSFVALSSALIQSFRPFFHTIKDIQRFTKIYLDLFF